MESLDNYIFNIKSFLIIKKLTNNSFISTQLDNTETISLISENRNISYNQSINSSCYKEIENNFNKLFIYKDKSDSWRICVIIKIIHEKAIIKEVTRMELYENEALYEDCLVIKEYINQTKAEDEDEDEIDDRQVYRLVDISNIKQLKSFLNGLKSFDLKKNKLIELKERISLSKFKNLLWKFFETVYSSSNNVINYMSSDLNDMKIITSDDYSYVKYVYAKNSTVDIVNNLIDLSIFEEKESRIKENEYENLNNSFNVLNKVQSFPFFRSFQVKFNFQFMFKDVLDRITTKFNSIYNDCHAFYYYQQKESVFEIFFFICSNKKPQKDQIFDFYFKEIIFNDINHDKIILFHNKISSINSSLILEKYESNQEKVIYFLIGNRNDIEYIEDIYNILIRLN